MFSPKIARFKLIPWLIATATVGFLPFGLAPAAQAQTVIYNGRTIVEDHDRDRYNDRYDDDDRYDNYDNGRRYDGYSRYGRYDNYDRYGRYDNYDRYGRYDNYDRYDDYDHYDHYDYDDYSRRRRVIVIPSRPSIGGQSNPACLEFQSLRIACRQ